MMILFCSCCAVVVLSIFCIATNSLIDDNQSFLCLLHNSGFAFVFIPIERVSIHVAACKIQSYLVVGGGGA